MTAPIDASVSVIIPVCNEAELLSGMLNDTLAFLQSQKISFEIIIIESGSTDESLKICQRFTATHPDVKLIVEGRRNGFGAAILEGLKAATKDFIWVVSVDCPFDLDAFTRARPLLSKYDFVLSYRHEDDRSLFRKIQSFFFNRVARNSLGIPFKHVNSAFKLMRRQRLLDMNLQSRGWLIDAEVLVRIHQLGAPFIEIPVKLNDRTAGASKVHWLTPFLMLRDLGKLRQKLET